MKRICKNGKSSFSAMTLTSLLCGSILFAACSKDFLKPDPLSFYEPSTLSTEPGLRAALAMADRHTRNYWTYFEGVINSVPIGTEYLFSELAVYGKTDATNNVNFDIAASLTPTGGTDEGNNDGNYIHYFWKETYMGIKYANAICSSIDAAEGLDEATKKAYLGRAYFHRSFRYLALAFQFGDVPLVTKILKEPKQNYRSTKKEAILQMITEDMEKAVQWVPVQTDMAYVGMVNKGACRVLLIKCYLATGQWQKAKLQADTLIHHSGYELMKNNFGIFNEGGETRTLPITRNVMWDLHRPENKFVSANKETIMGMTNHGAAAESFVPFLTMRIFSPLWNTGNLKSPDGKNAIEPYTRNNGNYNPQYDFLRAVGRGIATLRPTGFATGALWAVNGMEDPDDLRHSSATGNWVKMTSLKYNNPTSAYFGKNLVLHHPETNALLCSDTIRCWFDWPHYKLYLKDVSAEANPGATQFNGATEGGNADWYLYRLAEVYLLRAEAKFYLGDATAKDDVNEVRKRAHCSRLYMSNVTIGDIMNERARELYLEEWRNTELSRVSYCLALSGKPDEWGNTYDLNTFDKQAGTDASGGSYWYQRIMHYSLYNKAPVNGGKSISYTMNKCNFYWPIPNAAITANNKGTLSQNYGYDGYDPTTPKWETWREAVADEDRTK